MRAVRSVFVICNFYNAHHKNNKGRNIKMPEIFFNIGKHERVIALQLFSNLIIISNGAEEIAKFFTNNFHFLKIISLMIGSSSF